MVVGLVAALGATSWQPATTMVPTCASPRAPPPTANFVFEAVQLSNSPAALLVLLFTASWASAPIIASTPLRDSSLIQSGKKMRTMPKEPPKIRGRPVPTELTSLVSATNSRGDVEVLWAALLSCCDGCEERAIAAARSNPQIINPSYSFCNTMLESQKVLLGVMPKQEALEVIAQNPAILQCGPALETASVAEIKLVARVRSIGNALVPAQIRGPAVSTLIAAIVAAVLFNNSSDPVIIATLDVVRPTLGAILGASFFFAAYAAARSS